MIWKALTIAGILMAAPVMARTQTVTQTVTVTRTQPDLPQCSLQKTSTHYVVLRGDEEIVRLKYSNGAHVVSLDSSHEGAFFTALRTYNALRENGLCR